MGDFGHNAVLRSLQRLGERVTSAQLGEVLREVGIAEGEVLSPDGWVAVVGALKRRFVEKVSQPDSDCITAFECLGGKADKSGHVCANELKSVIDAFQLNVDISGLLNDLDDGDQDGLVSFSEFCCLLRSQPAGTKGNHIKISAWGGTDSPATAVNSSPTKPRPSPARRSGSQLVSSPSTRTLVPSNRTDLTAEIAVIQKRHDKAKKTALKGVGKPPSAEAAAAMGERHMMRRSVYSNNYIIPLTYERAGQAVRGQVQNSLKQDQLQDAELLRRKQISGGFKAVLKRLVPDHRGGPKQLLAARRRLKESVKEKRRCLDTQSSSQRERHDLYYATEAARSVSSYAPQSTSIRRKPRKPRKAGDHLLHTLFSPRGAAGGGGGGGSGATPTARTTPYSYENIMRSPTSQGSVVKAQSERGAKTRLSVVRALRKVRGGGGEVGTSLEEYDLQISELFASQVFVQRVQAKAAHAAAVAALTLAVVANVTYKELLKELHHAAGFVHEAGLTEAVLSRSPFHLYF